MRSKSCLLVLLFALPFPAVAQTTPIIPHAGESIEVSIVNVDTVVTDKQGRRVHGLRRDDFEVYENGIRQPITNFAEYASERDATPAQVALAWLMARPSITAPIASGTTGEQTREIMGACDLVLDKDAIAALDAASK